MPFWGMEPALFINRQFGESFWERGWDAQVLGVGEALVGRGGRRNGCGRVDG